MAEGRSPGLVADPPGGMSSTKNFAILNHSRVELAYTTHAAVASPPKRNNNPLTRSPEEDEERRFDDDAVEVNGNSSPLFAYYFADPLLHHSRCLEKSASGDTQLTIFGNTTNRFPPFVSGSDSRLQESRGSVEEFEA